MTVAVEPSLVFADPGELVIGENVRGDARLDKEFIASIRERGVLEPIVAYRDGDGHLVVLRGKRRTMTAVEVGQSRVPVMVVAPPAESDRVVDQVAENDHRAALTSSERVAAFEQLTAFGLSAAQIAKKTARPRAEITAGLKVAGSTVARAATEKLPTLDLRQAGVIAEFDGDKQAVDRLLDAAQRGGFDHAAQRLRDERDAEAAKAKAVDQLLAAGVRVVKAPLYNATAKRLAQLTATVGGDELTDAEHATCPGHAAYVDQYWNSRGKLAWRPAYVCTDPQAQGHVLLYGRYDGASASSTEKTEDEREAARAERRDVIDSNKAWVSAETVRRNWLRAFAARKTAPKSTERFIASSFASCNHAIRSALDYGNVLAHDILGAGDPGTYRERGQAIDALLEGAPDGRAQLVVLVLVLAAYEEGTSKNSWRSVDSGTRQYLRFIEGQGYELSWIELRACGVEPRRDTDDV